jgi:hypothetical protein
MADPLLDLTAAGVAIWLDDLSRARLATASLAGLVNNCHVVGVTSNPVGRVDTEIDQRLDTIGSVAAKALRGAAAIANASPGLLCSETDGHRHEPGRALEDSAVLLTVAKLR